MAPDTSERLPSSNETGDALLVVDDLRRSFGAVRALDGLTLEIPRKSITGLIGPNGCGKTTAVNCITGFDQQFSGVVSLEGKSLTKLKPDGIARLGAMRTFQAIRVFDEKTVLRNVVLANQCFDGTSPLDVICRSRGFRRAQKEAEQRARKLLDLVGILEKADEPAGNLSYGQKKLLALASILMSGPKLIILDEPVAGVNPSLVHEIAEVLKSLNASGISFLVIEHNIEFVMQLCDRVVVMDRGRRLAEGTPSQIRASDSVAEAYLGEEHGS